MAKTSKTITDTTESTKKKTTKKEAVATVQ
jgi:hypothetical protein